MAIIEYSRRFLLIPDKNGEDENENGDKEAEKEEEILENTVTELTEAADTFVPPPPPEEEEKKITRRGSAKRKKSLAIPGKTPVKRPSLRRKSHKV